MRKSRFFYLHPETNPSKLDRLEALAVEYRKYLQSCTDHMISLRRMSVSKPELLNFFFKSTVLNTNIVNACQQHGVAIVLGWASSRYTLKIKAQITNLKFSGEITDNFAKQLYTIGKYNIDRASAIISQEALDYYWEMLFAVGAAPIISDRVGMRMSQKSSTFKLATETSLAPWWLTFSTLTHRKTVDLPVKGNPYVKLAEEIRKGCLVRKDKRGRWRVEVLDKVKYDDPRYDVSAPRVGIDVGLNVIAATSDGRLYGADQKPKFNALKAKVDTLRANRQRQDLPRNSKRLNVLEERLSGFIKTLTGTVANKLVKSYEGYTFVLEDLNLSGAKGSKRFAYRALADALGRKAPCLAVNPAYTSQECPSCGYISRSNRKGTKFNCRGCGRLSHADIIGAINILRRSQDLSIDCDTRVADVKADLQRRYAERRRRPEDQPSTEVLSCTREFTVGMNVGNDRTRIAPNALREKRQQGHGEYDAKTLNSEKYTSS